MTHDHRTMAHGKMPCHCLVYRVADVGRFLATREAAATIREECERPVGDGLVVVLDFAGVEAITMGFADELVAKLRAEHGDRVRWEDANPEVEDAIQTAIGRCQAATIYARS